MAKSRAGIYPRIRHPDGVIPRLLRSFTALLEAFDRAKNHVEAMSEPFIGKAEAARYLNMSVTTLERRMALRHGPLRYVDGGKVNFRRCELLAWHRQWRTGEQTGLEQ